MVIFWRIVSVLVLLAVAVVVGTLWAKAIAVVVGGGGLLLFILAPLPVVAGIYALGSWIDRKLVRLAKRKAGERNIHRSRYRW